MIQRGFRNTILGLALLTSLTNASCFYQGAYHKELTGVLVMSTLIMAIMVKVDTDMQRDERIILTTGKALAVIVAIFCTIYAIAT